MPFSGFSCPSGGNYHTSCLLLLPASGAFPLGASLIHSAENELACSANRDTMGFEANLAHCVSERWEQLTARAAGAGVGTEGH